MKLISVILLILFVVAQADAALTSSRVPRTQTDDDQHQSPPVQSFRDEFNTSETLIGSQHGPSMPKEPVNNDAKTHLFARLLRATLMRLELDRCCPNWANLSRDLSSQIALSLAEQHSTSGAGTSFYGLSRSKSKHEPVESVKPSDLLNELVGTFTNITQLSIDGQPGQSEAEKYYKFYDGVAYYLRLVKVAQTYLDQAAEPKAHSNGSANDKFLQKLTADFRDILDYKLTFKRKLESLRFKISSDPFTSSFIQELQRNSAGATFELYENFIKNTKFGHSYARNISTVRDSVRAFDQICQHLTKLTFPSNLTRPSKQYEMIRRMSHKLFNIRHHLLHKVSARILSNRHDTRRLFSQLDELINQRPEVRMLGDEFGDSEEHKFYSKNVKLLTSILDRYTTNNMTQLTFYNQLSELPEDFIILGTRIAHEYELRELPQYNRFDYDHFGSEWARLGGDYNKLTEGDSDNNASSAADARHSTNGYFLSRILG